MKAYWDAHSEEDEDLEADIVACKLVDDQINVLFKSSDEDDGAEGRISIPVKKGPQVLDAVWRYPDAPIEKSRFTEEAYEQEDVEIKAIVRGELIDFDGRKVLFRGVWEDELNGPAYDFELDARTS